MKRTPRCLLSMTAAAVLVVINANGALASTAPNLMKAASFAVLAGSTVTNALNTVVNGDLGVSAGTAVTGFPPGVVQNGAVHTGTDALAVSAKNDLTKAYGVAASSPCNFNETGTNLGGQTLTPGTYCQTTAPTLTGTLTLSGNGVFIFQAGSTLITAPGATVNFINGAQPCNVFWQVGSNATLDTTTTFVGTIMALGSISLNNGATIMGRALAQTGQVSLINNHITAPTTCNAVTVSGPTPAPSPGPSPRIPKVPPTGANPLQDNGYPWILALLLAGATGVVVSLRPRRRRSR